MASNLLPFAQMWPMVADKLQPLQSEHLPLYEATYHVSRAPLCAAWDLPRCDNSAMDGYALHEDDLAAGRPLRLLDADAYAGTADAAIVTPGSACPIGTGGVIPAGATAVAQREIVEREGDQITLRETVRSGMHIRRQGEELRQGDVVVPAGAMLTPARIAACAVAGIEQAEVGRWPACAVISTGSELAALGDVTRPGQVIDSNGPLLGSWIERLSGQEPLLYRRVVDDEEEHDRVISAALDQADLLLLTGGVSVGDRDLVKTILEQRLGVERLFWRVAQKPGKPVYVGTLGKKWIVGLPGNPAAVAVSWPLLVKPLMLALAGHAAPQPERFHCRLTEATTTTRSRTVLRWCTLSTDEGQLTVTPLARTGSHMLSDLAQADALAILPPADDPQVPAGTVVEAIRIGVE